MSCFEMLILEEHKMDPRFKHKAVGSHPPRELLANPSIEGVEAYLVKRRRRLTFAIVLFWSIALLSALAALSDYLAGEDYGGPLGTGVIFLYLASDASAELRRTKVSRDELVSVVEDMELFRDTNEYLFRDLIDPSNSSAGAMDKAAGRGDPSSTESA